MATPPADQPTMYAANCHCGALQYTVELPQPLESKPKQVMSCNCSICDKNGYLLVYPSISKITFTKGQLADCARYEFADKNVTHCFCKTCGSSVFVDDLRRSDVVCVNIRMFKNIDTKALDVIHYDGFEKMEPRYQFA